MAGSPIPNSSDAKVRVGGKTVTTVAGSGSILSGIVYDAIDIDYPNSTTEVYEYYSGGLAGDLLATVTITYVSAAKKDILTVVRT